MIYLASPYSHPDPAVRAERYARTLDFTSHWIKLGAAVFSPIVYCHQFVPLGHGTSAGDWNSFNLVMMRKSRRLWVLMLPGWDESRGVGFEIDWFRAHNIKPEMKEHRRG